MEVRREPYFSGSVTALATPTNNANPTRDNVSLDGTEGGRDQLTHPPLANLLALANGQFNNKHSAR